MKIETELIGNIAVLTLVGELDSRGNQGLDKAIKGLASRNLFKIILDVQSIRFIGSQTVSLLISNLKEIRAGGGDIKMIKPQRAVLQYLKQNRIFEIFDIFASKAEAVHAFEKAAPKEIPEEKSLATNAEPTSIPLSPVKEKTDEKLESGAVTAEELKSKFETGEILYANSCMIATMIQMLESKGILSSEEARELMDAEKLSMKGAVE